MAEVRKNKNIEKYNLEKINETKEEKTKIVKKSSSKNNEANAKSETKKKEEKKNIWVRFRIFCHGVSSEFKKVKWPTKTYMIKYSVATIFFVVFLAVFFYLIDILFAFLQSLV